MTETNALGPSARGSGRRSNFSISGNETSITEWCRARAALIIALNPVAITLCSALIYREALPLSRLIGIPLSVIGALVVITRGQPLHVFSGGVGRGELLIFGCVLSWTLYSVIGKTAMRGLSPLAAVCWSSIAGTLLLSIPALAYGSLPEAVHFSWPVWCSIGYLGLFGTVVGFLWYFEGIQTIGPSRAAVARPGDLAQRAEGPPSRQARAREAGGVGWSTPR